MAIEAYANNASTALTAGIDAIVTLFQVDDVSLFPTTTPTPCQFRIKIDNELMLVTDVTTVLGNFFFTVTRGVENTTATTHALGATVTQILTAEGLANNPRSMENQGDMEVMDNCGQPSVFPAPSNGIYGIKWTSKIPSWQSVGTTTAGDIAYYAGTIGPTPLHAPSTDGLYAVAWTNSVPTWVTISLQVIPPGVISEYGGASAPSGYLMCDGSAVSRSTYSALFSIISTNYGTGNGTTTFNVPDMRQRYPIGKAASGYASTLGVTFGTFDHTHTVAAHTHDIAHTHTFTTSTDGDHDHAVSQAFDFDRTGGGTGDVGNPVNSDGAHNHSGTTSAPSTLSSGATALTSGTNNPPSLVMNYIIKT